MAHIKDILKKFHNKFNKRTVMLLVSAIVALSVCSSAVYAWIIKSPTSSANFSAKILNFNFTTNGKFYEDITITGGDSITSDNFIYTYSPKGMYPGQTIQGKLVLANIDSDWDAKYKVSVKGFNAPLDCLLEVKDNTGKGFEVSTLTAGTVVCPVNGNGVSYENTTYAYLSVGETNELNFTMSWPKDYVPTEEGGPGVYASAQEKNDGDLTYLKSCKDENGNLIKNFSVVFQIEAEQIIDE